MKDELPRINMCTGTLKPSEIRTIPYTGQIALAPMVSYYSGLVVHCTMGDGGLVAQ